MSFSGHRRALVDAAFAMFGEDAAWAGREFPVRVRLRTEDEEGSFSRSRFIARSLMLRVRSWEIAEPVQGDRLTVIGGVNAGIYEISGAPQIDAKGVWHCPIALAP